MKAVFYIDKDRLSNLNLYSISDDIMEQVPTGPCTEDEVIRFAELMDEGDPIEVAEEILNGACDIVLMY